MHATAPPYRLGSVVYDPKVRHIWDDFGRWFSEHRFPLDVSYFETYEDQVDTLVDGRLDAAWNTNLAYVQTLERTSGRARPIAMRDTDRGWTSKIVVLESSPIEDLEALRGRRVGFGDRDSPQAHLLPVHSLAAQGIDPRTDMRTSRLDRDVGKHGDTGGAELAQLERLRSGELDACVLSSVTLDFLAKAAEADGLRVIWTSPRFHHCNFTVLEDSSADHVRFVELLKSMDPADESVCDAMALEYVNRWVDPDASGYADLIEAVRAGPVIVG